MKAEAGGLAMKYRGRAHWFFQWKGSQLKIVEELKLALGGLEVCFR